MREMQEVSLLHPAKGLPDLFGKIGRSNTYEVLHTGLQVLKQCTPECIAA